MTAIKSTRKLKPGQPGFPLTPVISIPHTETVGAMVQEIAKMQAYCLAHYDEGYDTMAECWDDEDYEDLFYESTHAAPVHNHKPVPRRVPFATAWADLHNLACVFRDQQADAAFHASQAEPAPTPSEPTPVHTPHTPHIQSLNAADTPAGVTAAAHKPSPRYTGTKVLGIATMHKSNLVPIFNADAAVDAAHMRRG